MPSGYHTSINYNYNSKQKIYADICLIESFTFTELSLFILGLKLLGSLLKVMPNDCRNLFIPFSKDCGLEGMYFCFISFIIFAILHTPMNNKSKTRYMLALMVHESNLPIKDNHKGKLFSYFEFSLDLSY